MDNQKNLIINSDLPIVIDNVSALKARFSKLTQRENECLSHLVKGLTAKEIARIMNISNRTIETHIENIKLKLGVRKKAQVMAQVFMQEIRFLDSQASPS